MSAVTDILWAVCGDVWATLQHNWPFLLASVVIASALQVYVGTDRLAAWLRRRTIVAVLGAVVVASLTPFCSCGTTAVVLGAMASAVPWAPVVAFMVSSPLTSPEEYVMSAGLFGPAFATTYFVAAIVIGLGAGAATFLIERTGWLVGQARMMPPELSADPEAALAGGCGCDAPAVSVPDGGAVRGGERGSLLTPNGRTTLEFVEAPPCCTALADDAPVVTSRAPSRSAAFRAALVGNGRRLAIYFLGFAALGYLIIELIPTRVLTDYLGGDSLLAVPLAALLGVPVYLNGDGSLPMVASLMDGGMGAGPALAFLITGAGTSIGAVSGMLVIARRRVVALVVGSLLVGAITCGWLAPLWL